jgi:predicted PolB exonuclease-like 3'-5' exonuclease
LARLMGLPGKLGMDGSAVWGAWLDGRIDEIRDYCETDVVNTHLVFLRFQMMRGLLTARPNTTASWRWSRPRWRPPACRTGRNS